MRKRRLMFTGVVLGASCVGLVLSGCSRTSSYRMNPSPGIDTRAQSPDEIQNKLTLYNDTNLRYFWNDVGRLFLMERRSHLDPGPNFR